MTSPPPNYLFNSATASINNQNHSKPIQRGEKIDSNKHMSVTLSQCGKNQLEGNNLSPHKK